MQEDQSAARRRRSHLERLHQTRAAALAIGGPALASAECDLGRALEQYDEVDAARAAFERVIGADHEDQSLRAKRLLALSIADDDPARSALLVQNVIEAGHPRWSRWASLDLARRAIAAGDRENANQILAPWVTVDSAGQEGALGHLLFGYVREINNDEAAAIAIYEQVVEGDDPIPALVATRLVTDIYFGLGHRTQANRVLTTALHIARALPDPCTEAQLLTELGAQSLDRLDYRNARAQLADAYALGNEKVRGLAHFAYARTFLVEARHAGRPRVRRRLAARSIDEMQQIETHDQQLQMQVRGCLTIARELA